MAELSSIALSTGAVIRRLPQPLQRGAQSKHAAIVDRVIGILRAWFTDKEKTGGNLKDGPPGSPMPTARRGHCEKTLAN